MKTKFALILTIILFITTVWIVLYNKYWDPIGDLNEKIDIQEELLLEKYNTYQKTDTDWKATISNIEKKYKDLLSQEIWVEQSKINTTKNEREQTQVALQKLYQEKSRLLWGSLNVEIPTKGIITDNPDRWYTQENLDLFLSWIFSKRWRPYKLWGKGWWDWFDCSWLFAAFGRFHWQITQDDLIYNYSAQKIYDKSRAVSIDKLSKWDLIYRTKPWKNYKEHIAMIVTPLTNNKIVIFDASPEWWVSERTITVTHDINTFTYTHQRGESLYNLVGSTNGFLEMPIQTGFMQSP